MPHLDRILIYPIKSLDPVSVKQSRVLRNGALEFDRQWAIVDASGKFINGKRTPIVHHLRAKFDDQFEHVTFAFENRSDRFHLSNDLDALETWLGDVFKQPVRLLENSFGGYPDDNEAPGPTVISTATLNTVASWFPPTTVDECRLRFRANLEIADAEPFWEDQLYGRMGSQVDFQVGSIAFAGTNPCQRCVVPTRNSQTGEVWPKFAAEFGKQREASLPGWAERSRFDHFYRLAVNTHLVGKGGTIRAGDPIGVE
jgi:uncharacterized protein